MTYYGDNAPKLTTTVIILAVLSLIVFILRIYTRLKNKTWGIDDWCIVVAVVPFTALTISCLGGSFHGIGVSAARLSAKESSIGVKWFFFFEVFYCAAIIPIKLSISFTLMRIASGRKLYVNSLYVVSAMFTIMNVIALLYIIFHCTPVQYAWDSSIPGGKCNSASILADIYYATTAVNIVTDWFSALLPIPLLWNLQLNRNSKISVGAILSLGILASLSACIRLAYTVNLTNSNDFLYGIVDVVIWGYAENGVGMFVANVATLRPLFKRIFNLGDSDPEPASSTNARWGTHSSVAGRHAQWVALRGSSEPMATKGATSSIHDGGSEVHILPTEIRVTKSVLQDVSYDKESKEAHSTA